MFNLSDFDFDLPSELIAQSAPAMRTASRLLDVADSTSLRDRQFSELPNCLRAGDLLIFNDTRVLKARLYGRKSSGGAVEILLERIVSDKVAICQLRASKPPKPGSQILIENSLAITVGEREESFFTLIFPIDVAEVLEQYGQLPLPPYIQHTPQAVDEQRYQTVYARVPGAVAAPTAGLHFDADLLEKITAAKIDIHFLTLHVGAGTFMPVRTENLAEHRMHKERYSLSPELIEAIVATRARGGRIIAVGTTTLRALESCAALYGPELRSGENETEIFITPGFRFQVVDMLITNFHLPKSTLMMLVSAFAGYEVVRAAYAHAIAQRYRFFSYGDAMLLTRI